MRSKKLEGFCGYFREVGVAEWQSFLSPSRYVQSSLKVSKHIFKKSFTLKQSHSCLVAINIYLDNIIFPYVRKDKQTNRQTDKHPQTCSENKPFGNPTVASRQIQVTTSFQPSWSRMTNSDLNDICKSERQNLL